MGVERRRSKRVRLDQSDPLVLELRDDDGELLTTARMLDLSEHGLGVLVPRTMLRQVEPLEQFDSRFRLPGIVDDFELRVIVRQRRPAAGLVHLGLEFDWRATQRQERERSELRRFVENFDAEDDKAADENAA